MMLRPLVAVLALALVPACQSGVPTPTATPQPAPQPAPQTDPEPVASSPTPPSSAAVTVEAPGAGKDPGGSTAVAQGTIEWKMTVSSTDVSLAQLGAWRFEISARNLGPTPSDTARSQLELLVNGQPSMGFQLGWGNGAMDGRWLSLPPGDTVREGREMGDALFSAPGTYELVLRLHGNPVARAKVRVR